MPERPGRARASFAVACVALAAAGVLLVATGVLLAPTEACTPHNCDPSSFTFYLSTQDAGTQVVVDLGNGQVQLASTAWDGTWLDFPGNRTITVVYPQGFTPDPAQAPTVWVSTGQTQDAGATSTSTAGSLDQFSYLTATGFQLNNGTCANYSVWFSVTGTMKVATTADAATVSDASHD